MSSVHAVTENLILVVRIASFYELNSETNKDIVHEVSNVMKDLGKKHDFLVWRTSLEIHPKEKNNA